MCASYGLGGGPREAPLPNDLPPLDEREHQLQLHEWATAQNSQARLTGVHARNFNPVIHMSDGERALAFGWWWLWRGHEKLPYSAFNARAETLVQRWYAPFQHRGLLPATWYVEKGATFSLPEDETMGLAAIITVTTEPNGDPLLSYALVTREAVGQAATVHHRMPLILPRSFHDEWLNPAQPGTQALAENAVHASDELSRATTIIAMPEQPDAVPTLF